jgi:hypothetical protein
MRRFSALVIALTLAGCSSPPEPPVVDWQQPATAVNTTAPDWHETTGVIQSPAVTGHWTKTIVFRDESQLWPPDVWYVVAHSPVVMISTPYTGEYFKAKAWLIKNGVTGLILYRDNKNCITCDTTIYLSR